MSHVTEAHARDFLIRLSALVVSNLTEAEASAKLASYPALMCEDFPPDTFSPTALAWVARRCRFFPSYAELRDVLSEWERHTKPRQVAQLPAPPPEPPRLPPTEIEREMVRALTQKAVGYLKPVQSKPDELTRPSVKASYVSDAHLLILKEAEAQAGGPLAEMARVRAENLRRKLLLAMEREAGQPTTVGIAG